MEEEDAQEKIIDIMMNAQKSIGKFYLFILTTKV